LTPQQKQQLAAFKEAYQDAPPEYIPAALMLEWFGKKAYNPSEKEDPFYGINIPMPRSGCCTVL
jgi:hypothetical protein